MRRGQVSHRNIQSGQDVFFYIVHDHCQENLSVKDSLATEQNEDTLFKGAKASPPPKKKEVEKVKCICHYIWPGNEAVCLHRL